MRQFQVTYMGKIPAPDIKSASIAEDSSTGQIRVTSRNAPTNVDCNELNTYHELISQI
jgi:hypothetical protein